MSLKSNSAPESADTPPISVPACFFFADAIDRSIGGYQVCKAIQQVIGTRGKVTGAQILNGLYRIYLSTNEARKVLIAQGVTIGDTYVSVIEVNPKIVRGAEESSSVKLIIGNLPLSVSNDEIERELKNLEGVNLKSRLFFENYRDDEGGLSSFKTGRRFAYINPPAKPLPLRFQCMQWKASLYHWGQKKKGSGKEVKGQEGTPEPEQPTNHNAEKDDVVINSTEQAPSSTNPDQTGEPSQNDSIETIQTRIDSFIPPYRRSRSRSRSNKHRRRSGSSRKRDRSPAEDVQHSPRLKNTKKDPTKPPRKTYTKAASSEPSSPASSLQVKNSFNSFYKNPKNPR